MATLFNWTPTLFECITVDTGLLFSSAKRYMRSSASGDFTVPTGKTCNGKYVFINANTTGATWHFNIPGVLDRSFYMFGGQNHDPGTPTPTTQLVTL